jgi:hypothetical protein
MAEPNTKTPEAPAIPKEALLEWGDKPLMPTLVMGEPCANCKAIGNYMCDHVLTDDALWKITSKQDPAAFVKQTTDAMLAISAVAERRLKLLSKRLTKEVVIEHIRIEVLRAAAGVVPPPTIQLEKPASPNSIFIMPQTLLGTWFWYPTLENTIKYMFKSEIPQVHAAIKAGVPPEEISKHFVVYIWYDALERGFRAAPSYLEALE